MFKYQRVYETLLGQALNPNPMGQVKVLCPFHDDKNPSLSINLETGLYHCFGCGESGNARDFARKFGYVVVNEASGFPDVVPEIVAESEKRKALPPPPKKNYSLDDYCQEKGLDKNFLISVCKVEEGNDIIKIPYFDEDGSFLYYKVRGAGKKFYYLNKDKNQAVVPYGLWRLKEIKEGDDLFIVEGESDVQTLWQNGYNALGIPGINTLTPDSFSYLEDLPLRRIYIVSENDKAGAEFVLNAWEILSIYYPQLFAKTYVVFPGDIRQKDINEIWNLRKDPEFFRSKISLLTTLRMNIDVAHKVLSNKKDDSREVRQIALFLYFKLKALYDENKQFWVWDSKEKQYKNVDDKDFLKDFLLQEGYTKPGKLNEISEVLKSFILNQESQPQPLGEEWVYCANGEVNYKTLEFKRHGSDAFIHHRIPFDYNPNARSELVDKVFSDWVDDPEYLFELIGYCLIRNYPGNKMFFLFGLGSNGKTTFTNILEELLTGRKYGRFYADNVARITLNQLIDSRFASASLYRKYVNLAGETSFNVISDTTVLKQLTGNEPITAERKFRSPFAFHNYAKLIFATNKIPPSSDTTEGWFRRVIIIEFKRIAPEKIDVNLLSKFTRRDYEYILYRSILALQRLSQRAFVFTIEKKENMRQKYEDLSNPVNYFIKVNCERTNDESDYIPTMEFIDALNKWLKQNKLPTMSSREINIQMQELGIERKRKRILGGSQTMCFVGIRFKEVEEDDISEYIEF